MAPPSDLPILCDLDGTLIDSKASVLRAFRWWGDLRGIPGDVGARLPHGLSSAAVAAHFAPHLDAEAEGAVIEERQTGDTEGVVALEGALELLTGHPRVAIVTSGSLPLARARLAAAGLPEPSVLVTTERTRVGKPDPEPFLLAAAELDAPPQECVVLEDAPAGVQAGLAAGMTVVGLLTTHTVRELAAAHAHIAAPAELDGALRALGLDGR